MRRRSRPIAVDYGLALAKMLVIVRATGAAGDRSSLIDSDQLWDVGTIQACKGAKTPAPVWFARRLGRSCGLWRRVEGLFWSAGRRCEARVILTSTPGDRIPVVASHKRNHVISVADVMWTKAAGKLAISPQAVCGHGCSRVKSSAVSRSTIRMTTALSGCGTKPSLSRSDKQRQLLGIAVSMHTGPVRLSVGQPPFCLKPVTRTVRTPSTKVFSGRDDWRSVLKYAERKLLDRALIQ